MKYYLNCKKIDTAINRAKKMLMNKANKTGLYENFGQVEVDNIEVNFIKCRYTCDKNDWGQLQQFNEWCMAYNNPR